MDTAGVATHRRLDTQVARERFALEAAASDAALAASPDGAQGWVTIAGHHLRLRVAGRELTDRVPGAFAQVRRHATSGGALTLDVDVWDEAGARVGPPDVEVWDRARSADGRFFEHATPHVVSWLDRASHRLVARVRSARGLSPGSLFQPFSGLLAVWLADRGTPAIHAGAVARDGRAVIVAGSSGAGKSTVTLSCLAAGFDYLGDDFVVLSSPEGGTPHTVHAVYGTAHLDRDHLARFSALDRATEVPALPDGNKVVLRIADRFPDGFTLAARVQAIVLPRLAPGSPTLLRQAPKSAALLAMIPSSLFIRSSATPAAFRALAGLVEAVPAYWLEMGTDLSAIPRALVRLWPGA